MFVWFSHQFIFIQFSFVMRQDLACDSFVPSHYVWALNFISLDILKIWYFTWDTWVIGKSKIVHQICNQLRILYALPSPNIFFLFFFSPKKYCFPLQIFSSLFLLHVSFPPQKSFFSFFHTLFFFSEKKHPKGLKMGFLHETRLIMDRIGLKMDQKGLKAD